MTSKLFYTLIIFTIFSLSSSFSVHAQSFIQERVFTVNYNGDSRDADSKDGLCADELGRCSLRAAIEETDAVFGIDHIIFALPESDVINLTLGELTITSSVYIVGPGARRLTVQRSFDAGTPDFRIFYIKNYGGGFTNIRGLTIKNGNANSDLGGGIFVDANRLLNLIDVALVENKAATGAAICNQGRLNLIRSLVSSNVSVNAGGAISSGYLSTSRILNSTITNNSARIGGAISNDGSMLLVSNTISHNNGSESANCFYNFQNGIVYALNSIIAGNPASNTTALIGNFTSLGNNLVTDARNSTGFTNNVNKDQVSNNNLLDPRLGDLANNGGQTDTRRLETNSPAIDRGNNCVKNSNCTRPADIPFFTLPSDQRIAFDRKTNGNVDIGAFESGSSAAGLYNTQFFTNVINSRTGTALAVLTGAKDNQKFYSFVTPLGRMGFNNVDNAEIYIFQYRSKKQLAFPALVISSNDTFISGQNFLQASEASFLTQKIIEN